MQPSLRMIEPGWRVNSKFLAVPTLGAIVLSLGALAYAYSIEPGWVEIQPVPLRLPNLDPAFSGYRLVQISDLHMDSKKNVQPLEEVVQRVNQLRPDLVAITGDFITHNPGRNAADLICILKKLAAPDGVFAVLGNHDHWGGAGAVRKILRKAGVIELSNSVHTLRRGDAVLHLAGIDDYMMGHDRLDLVLKHLPARGAAILLAHEPDYADISAASGRFDLQLSGHSHGGQIRLPVIGNFYLPHFARKYPYGLYRVGKMIQYTNRGLGTVHLPFRFNSRPEITIFTLGETKHGELERYPGPNGRRR